MGCRFSKDETSTNTPQVNEMSKDRDNKIDYKSRLEHKMCLAKETPEPDFDLSECNLKDVPSGVFVHCRVLRKEILNLSRNKLTIFYGGQFTDLALLQILDLRFNKLKQLPEDISRIENLRELLVSNNLIVKLPQTINSLKYLELLDVSCNKIQSINEINCMSRLRILNITENANLRRIPATLATCDNLIDIVLDIDIIEWPPTEVTRGGTANIIKYLTTGESKLVEMANIEIGTDATQVDFATEDAMLKNLHAMQVQSKKVENKKNYNQICDDGYGNENALLELLQQRQQKQKEEFLQTLLMQERETENLVHKLQQQKDGERTKLIDDVLRAEQNASIVIEKLLALKNNLDAALLEKERLEEERLLEELHLEHSDLRKQEVLLTMMDLLKDEEHKIQDYQQQRKASSRDILEREQETSVQLGEFFRAYEKNREEIIEKICDDEELQKIAVAALIENNDARTWGLVEQLKIVEAQLAAMTHLEIEKKKFTTVEQMNEIADKRMRLTFVLLDLLEQQESRKKQLLDTLLSMEAQKSDEQDFWLLQYQRLLDCRPLEFALKTNSIDPLLGYNFLVNGVIHCLPFLQKFWQTTEINLQQLTNEDLETAGIRDEKDRRLILRSIIDYLKDTEYSDQGLSSSSATAPPLSPTKNSPTDIAQASSLATQLSESNETPSECVICMEETVKIIFVPCGHMCCCLNCQLKVDICPMCRGEIERKIKVVQP